MKILLINNNPVVSRLTALSARKENVELDEIRTISELKASKYDIIFVDGESYNNDVSNIIRNSGVEKRVLFYVQGGDEHQSIFTKTILKPFLPSEVSEILRDTKVTILKSKEKSKEKKKEKNVNFSDLAEENSQKDLEVLNIIENKEPTQQKKTTKETEALIALASVATAVSVDASLTDDKSVKEKLDLEDVKKETLEIKKDSFDEKLEEAFPMKSEDEIKVAEVVKKDTPKIEINSKKDMFDLDDDIFDLDNTKETKMSDSNLFELDEKKDALNNKIDNDLFEIDKEIKKDILEDAPLDFDIESKDEVSFESKKIEIEPKTTPKIETKILDNHEIANIKDIIDEKDGAENLTEIPTSLMSIQEKNEDKKEEKIIEDKKVIKEKEKEKEKVLEKSYSTENNFGQLSTGDAMAHTLSKLPVEDLRKLLRGAKVNISIEFSNEV